MEIVVTVFLTLFALASGIAVKEPDLWLRFDGVAMGFCLIAFVLSLAATLALGGQAALMTLTWCFALSGFALLPGLHAVADFQKKRKRKGHDHEADPGQ